MPFDALQHLHYLLEQFNRLIVVAPDYHQTLLLNDMFTPVDTIISVYQAPFT